MPGSRNGVADEQRARWHDSSFRGIVPFGNNLIHTGGHMGAIWILLTVLLVILWAAVMTWLVLAIIGLVRSHRNPKDEQTEPGPTQATGPAGSSATTPVPETGGLKILEERYAKGEIGHDEYLERKKDLTGS